MEKLQGNEPNKETAKKIEEAHQIFVNCIGLKQDAKDRIFNSGIFNDIVIGYGKLAAQRVGLDVCDIKSFEIAMTRVLDLFDAEDARSAYRQD